MELALRFKPHPKPYPPMNRSWCRGERLKENARLRESIRTIADPPPTIPPRWAEWKSSDKACFGENDREKKYWIENSNRILASQLDATTVNRSKFYTCPNPDEIPLIKSTYINPNVEARRKRDKEIVRKNVINDRRIKEVRGFYFVDELMKDALRHGHLMATLAEHPKIENSQVFISKPVWKRVKAVEKRTHSKHYLHLSHAEVTEIKNKDRSNRSSRNNSTRVGTVSESIEQQQQQQSQQHADHQPKPIKDRPRTELKAMPSYLARSANTFEAMYDEFGVLQGRYDELARGKTANGVPLSQFSATTNPSINATTAFKLVPAMSVVDPYRSFAAAAAGEGVILSAEGECEIDLGELKAVANGLLDHFDQQFMANLTGKPYTPSGPRSPSSGRGNSRNSGRSRSRNRSGVNRAVRTARPKEHRGNGSREARALYHEQQLQRQAEHHMQQHQQQQEQLQAMMLRHEREVEEQQLAEEQAYQQQQHEEIVGEMQQQQKQQRPEEQDDDGDFSFNNNHNNRKNSYSEDDAMRREIMKQFNETAAAE